jgi:hypothetical protein
LHVALAALVVLAVCALERPVWVPSQMSDKMEALYADCLDGRLDTARGILTEAAKGRKPKALEEDEEEKGDSEPPVAEVRRIAQFRRRAAVAATIRGGVCSLLQTQTGGSLWRRRRRRGRAGRRLWLSLQHQR